VNHFRSNAKRYGLLWVFYLATTLVFIQGSNLHLDVHDHQHHNHEIAASGHEHVNVIHVFNHVVDAAHSHETVAEVDIIPDGVIKNLALGLLAIALLASAIITLVSQYLCRRISWHLNQGALPVFWRIRPPLRAPPL